MLKERYGIIYKITNKVDGKVYIGQTVKKRGFRGRYTANGEGIERLYNYHKLCKDKNSYYNKHLLRSIEKYGFENFEVIEEFDIAYSKDELDKKEIYYIDLYKSYDDRFGYNKTLGGANGKVSEESRIRMSNAQKRSWEGKTKKIVQLSLNGEFIKEYRCATEAEGFVAGSIYRCCHKEIREHKGYLWLFSEEYYSGSYSFKENKTPSNIKKVVVIFLDGRIEEFNTVRESEEKTGIGIIRNLVGNKNNNFSIKYNCIAYHKDDFDKLIYENPNFVEDLIKYCLARKNIERGNYKIGKIIVMLDKNNLDFLDIFNYSTEAKEQLNISNKGICNVLKNRSKTAGGYKWKYLKDYLIENPNMTEEVCKKYFGKYNQELDLSKFDLKQKQENELQIAI